jgi:hypothetical protein
MTFVIGIIIIGLVVWASCKDSDDARAKKYENTY